jgi:hypothetical protein
LAHFLLSFSGITRSSEVHSLNQAYSRLRSSDEKTNKLNLAKTFVQKRRHCSPAERPRRGRCGNDQWRLYAVGGSNGSSTLSLVEAYDPATNTWTSQTPMPTARFFLGGGVVNGILYAVGGDPTPTGGSTTTANEAFSIAQVVPTTTEQCKKGGWQTYGVFKNQGDCVTYVATKGKNQ